MFDATLRLASAAHDLVLGPVHEVREWCRRQTPDPSRPAEIVESTEAVRIVQWRSLLRPRDARALLDSQTASPIHDDHDAVRRVLEWLEQGRFALARRARREVVIPSSRKPASESARADEARAVAMIAIRCLDQYGTALGRVRLTLLPQGAASRSAVTDARGELEARDLEHRGSSCEVRFVDLLADARRAVEDEPVPPEAAAREDDGIPWRRRAVAITTESLWLELDASHELVIDVPSLQIDLHVDADHPESRDDAIRLFTCDDDGGTYQREHRLGASVHVRDLGDGYLRAWFRGLEPRRPYSLEVAPRTARSGSEDKYFVFQQLVLPSARPTTVEGLDWTNGGSVETERARSPQRGAVALFGCGGTTDDGENDESEEAA